MKLNNYPDWALAILSGILVGVSYLPIPARILIYIGLVPLLHIWLNKSLKTSASMSYLAAVTAHTIAFYWMGLNQGATVFIAFLSLVAAVFYLGIFWVLVGIAISFLQKSSNIAIF